MFVCVRVSVLCVYADLKSGLIRIPYLIGSKPIQSLRGLFGSWIGEEKRGRGFDNKVRPKKWTQIQKAHEFLPKSKYVPSQSLVCETRPELQLSVVLRASCLAC